MESFQTKGVTVKPSAQMQPSPIRLPQDLKDWLKHKAVDNRRSFNGEVLMRLEQSRASELEAKGEKT